MPFQHFTAAAREYIQSLAMLKSLQLFMRNTDSKTLKQNREFIDSLPPEYF